MKTRATLLSRFVIGLGLAGIGWLPTSAFAQTATPGSDAWATAEPIPYWWFHGSIEAGGRFFVNNPQKNGSKYLNQDSLAKYYEYSDIKPGAFGNFWMSTGSRDGLYQIDLGGKNVGYEDQNYYFDASKAGEHYFNFSWDQTPHTYSTSAQTFYQGVGTTKLTLPPGWPVPVIGANASQILPFLYQTDLGIRRDTAAFAYRWTPTDAWDINADYSHMYRHGTQVEGVVGFGPKTGATSASGFNPTQVPRPVDDTTQNYGLNGEYAGTSPWGQRLTFKMAYNGSTYSDDFTSYLVQNPYCSNTGVCPSYGAGRPETPFARISTWPSNNANAFSGTLAADLPWMSRYVGTLTYDMMRQNDAFIPMSYQTPGFPLPGSSLNGAINTLLSNNIITTHITPELTSKLSYRYYNFDNATPQLFFPCTGAPGVNCTTAWIAYDQVDAREKQIQSLSMQYTKQNAGADLNWRPTKEWNLGAAYGYERYDYTQVDATSTDQNSGKVYADWTPKSWVTFRASGYYSNRTSNNYDYLNNVGFIQFPGTTPAGNSFFYSPAYRQLMIDDRRQWKVKLAMDLAIAHGLTVTPTYIYQDNYYPDVNGVTTLGIQDSKNWSAGVDVTYLINPVTSISVGYMYENYAQLLYGMSGTGSTSVIGVGGVYQTQTTDVTTVNTFTAVARYEAIPDKLNFDLRYAASRGVDNMKLNLGNGAQPSGGQYPDFTTWFQRFDAEATYKLDKNIVSQLGWKGDVKAKLHYVWESNSVANWQNDPLAPYSPFVSANSIWMAYDNPNYNVQMLLGSLIFNW